MNARVLCSTNGMSRDEWLVKRQLGIGGSDIAKIAGLSRYGNALSVYAEKIGPVEDREQSEAAEIGVDLEEYVAKKFSQRTGLKVRRMNAILCHPEHEWMMANIDRLILGDPQAILECKLGGTKSGWSTEDDEIVVPEDYYCQVQWYLGVMGFPKAYIAALLGGFGGMQLIIKEIERDYAVIEALMQMGSDFWRCVVNRTPPALDERGCLVGIEFKPDPPKIILPEDPLVPKIRRYLSLSEQLKPLEKERDSIKEELHALMDLSGPENELFSCGGYNVTRKIVRTLRFDTGALRLEDPELYSAYLKESVQRRLTIKEGEKK